MRYFAILSMAFVVAAAYPLQTSEPEKLLGALLRDIAANELTLTPTDESLLRIGEVLDSRTSRDSGLSLEPEQCRQACVDESATLEALCDLHIVPTAARSRAVCYSRVDADRARCMAVCDE
jgi:hypothetical protein